MSVRAEGLVRAFTHVVPFASFVFVALEWGGIPGQAARDSLAYQQAAARARAHESIYAAELEAGPHEFHGEWPYLYPPPLAALLSFLPTSSYRTFDRLWLLVTLVGFWLFAATLARLHRGRWNLASTLRWGAALFVVPGALLAIHFANVEPVIWALVGMGIAVPAVGGGLLAGAAAIKVTPMWALVPLLVRRPRKILPSALLAVAILTLACVVRFGVTGTWHLSREWAMEVAPGVGQGQFWGGSLAALREHVGPLEVLGNLSLSFLPVQLAALAGWDYGGGPLPTPVRTWLLLAGVLVPLAVIWLTRHRSPRMQAALTLVAASFAAPIARPYVVPFLLIPIALALSQREGVSSEEEPP